MIARCALAVSARVTEVAVVADTPGVVSAIRVEVSASVTAVASVASMKDATTRRSHVDCASCTEEEAAALFLTVPRALRVADCAVRTVAVVDAWLKGATRRIVVQATA